MADFNLLTPVELNDLIYTPFQQAIGEQEHRRLQRQYKNYLYYDGYQHRGKSGELVAADELERPAGLDYDPTRYTTNYFKAFIKRKARWQMSGNHSISVTPKRIDSPELTEPSEEQKQEHDRAERFESLLLQLWRENNARNQLLQAARDRLIAGRVAVKMMYNKRTGKLKWVWHPDTETFPIFSDDDFGDLIGCSFVTERTDEEGKVYYRKQTFELVNGECHVSEGDYNTALKLIREITPKSPMGLDFVPVVLIPIEDLVGDSGVNKEVDDIIALTDRLNQLNEDAIDSLKFEMFGLTALINAPAGTANKIQIAPGAVLEITGNNEVTPDIKRVEGNFRWKEAFGSQYDRIKAALHDITSIPAVNPQDLNFGGMNTDALHIVFHDIIADTEEHWHAWERGLTELHEKSIRYLQARQNESNFGYDRETLRLIGDNYEHEIVFALPLPDSRAELVELLTLEMTAGLESQQGALARLGVDNTVAKQSEIQSERTTAQRLTDPYGETDV